jgi:molybdenum cofactor synthesis domain-containing protein
VRVAILTISDAASRGEREDRSGPIISGWAVAHGWHVTERAVVADEPGDISRALREWADGDKADLIVTTGGTGLTIRDNTPEATRSVLDREAPGISEAMRAAVLPRFPRAALSRAVAGTRRRALIINLPGSPGGVRDGLAVLDGIVEHAVELLRGDRTEHG